MVIKTEQFFYNKNRTKFRKKSNSKVTNFMKTNYTIIKLYYI